MDRRHFIAVIPVLALLGCAATHTDKPATPQPGFSAADRALITNFYGGATARSRPAQRVKPGDILETGSRPAKLPTNLDSQLSPLPAPYTRLTLGADVILVNRDTHAIVDVIPQIAH